MTFLTRPGSMKLEDWANQVVLDLDARGSLYALTTPEQWQDWANQFLAINTIGSNLPNPYQFKDWQDWAERFCGALS